MIMGMKEDVVREIVKCVVVPRPDESAKLVSTNAGRQASRPRSGTTLMTLLDQQMSRVIGNGSSTNGGGSASSSRGVSQYGMADVYPTATTTTMAMNGTAGHVGGRGGGSGRLTLAATGAGAGSGRLTSPAPVNGTRDMQSAGTSISGLPTSSGLLPHNVNSPIVNSISSPHLAGPTTTAAFAQHSGRTWSGQRQRSSIAYGRQQMTANCSGGLTGTHEVVVGDKRGRERDRDREKVLPSFRELDASLRRRK